MNPPILPNGTLVQLISTAEFDSLPHNDTGDVILGKEPDGSNDVMSFYRRPLCGCIAEIVGYWHKSFPYYMLKLVDASTAANPEFASDKDCLVPPVSPAMNFMFFPAFPFLPLFPLTISFKAVFNLCPLPNMFSPPAITSRSVPGIP